MKNAMPCGQGKTEDDPQITQITRIRKRGTEERSQRAERYRPKMVQCRRPENYLCWEVFEKNKAWENQRENQRITSLAQKTYRVDIMRFHLVN